jgi:hypothetical protein
MKLKIGNKIKYDDAVYTVVAIIFATVYLCVSDSGTYGYEIREVYETYKDIEILEKEGIYGR